MPKLSLGSGYDERALVEYEYENLEELEGVQKSKKHS